MIYYVIPARKNSVGLPNKNRKLFQFTATTIPTREKKQVLVTSDDEYILIMAEDQGFISYKRPDELCSNTASMKSVLIDIAKYFKLNNDDLIVTLYLTYPERTWSDIENALRFFNNSNAKSLLCKKILMGTHPALLMFSNGIRGKQLFQHDLYRRQDYPPVFEISHYISICQVDELKKLNQNLYNDDTIFFSIDSRTIDIDTQQDLDNFVNKTNGGMRWKQQ